MVIVIRFVTALSCINLTQCDLKIAVEITKPYVIVTYSS